MNIQCWFLLELTGLISLPSSATVAAAAKSFQSCPTLSGPMDCNMPGFSVLRCLPQFAQTHVHWVNDAIQPSHPLLPSSYPALNLSQHQDFFSIGWLFVSGGQSIRVSASVLPMNIQDWFSLGSPWSPRDSQESSPVLWTLWERERVGRFGRMALKHVKYHVWNEMPVQVQCTILDAWG